MSTRRAVYMALASALFTTGCTEAEEPTQVVVELVADVDVLERIERLEVSVAGANGLRGLDGTSPQLLEPVYGPRFPLRIVLAPRDGRAEERVFTLEATALDAMGVQISRARIISGYIPRGARFVQLRIEGGACLTRRCDDAQTTCSDGACFDARVDVADLSTRRAEPTPADSLWTRASDAPDAGAGADAGDAQTSAVCDPGFVLTDGRCVDEHECDRGLAETCGEGASACDDTEGSYRCTCRAGFERGPSGTCLDSDECADGAQAACGEGALDCSNEQGDYRCACDLGFRASADAHACVRRAWGSPAVLETANENAAKPAAVFDSAGIAHVLFEQTEGSRTRIARTRYVDGRWEPPLYLGTSQYETVSASSAALTADSDGHVLAAWIESHSATGTTDLLSSEYTSATGWSKWTYLNLGPGARPRCCVELAYGNAGDAMATWFALTQPPDSPVAQTWGARRSPSGSWAAPVLVMRQPDTVVGYLTVLPDGRYLAAAERSFDTDELWVNFSTVVGTWDDTQAVSIDRNLYGEFSGAVDHNGVPHLFWHRSFAPRESRFDNVISALDARTGTFAPPSILTLDGERALGLGFDPDGTRITFESVFNATRAETELHVSVNPPSASEPTVLPVVKSAQRLNWGAMARAGDGTWHLAWVYQTGVDARQLFSATYRGGVVSTPVRVDLVDANLGGMVLRTSSDGRAVLAWHQQDGARTNLHASVYE
jgi:Calcium-binding EGF domain